MKKGKYDIRISYPTRLVEVDAYEFSIFGYGTFIVHKDPFYHGNWSVSEPRSGLSVIQRASSKAKAIEVATSRLYEMATQEEVEDLVSDALKLLPDELIPRYYKETYGEKKV